jgi:hypothetical protein
VLKPPEKSFKRPPNRWRRYRERQRTGKVVLPIVVDGSMATKRFWKLGSSG